MNKSKEIYKYIDRNGIPYVRLHRVSISIDAKSKTASKPKDKLSYKLALPFILSEDEKLDIIINYIYDLTGFEISSIEDLAKLKCINGKPFILEIEKEFGKAFCVAFKTIPGSLVIRGDNYFDKHGNLDEIRTLGGIERIKGDLGISYSEIRDLGKLKQIDGDLWFGGDDTFRVSGFKINTLTPLQRVKGNVSIRAHSLETLGSLERVEGNLSLRFCNVRDLGALKYVGGNLLIKRELEHLYNLPDLKVEGKIRRYQN